jgi:hypothetical protein
MRQQRQSGSENRHPKGRWAIVTVVATVLVGAARLASQEVAPGPGQHPAARAFRQPPRLLSQGEVERGLASRHRALRQRFEGRQHRRNQGPPEDYAIPEPPAHATVPPRPDAPQGEFHGGGDR